MICEVLVFAKKRLVFFNEQTEKIKLLWPVFQLQDKHRLRIINTGELRRLIKKWVRQNRNFDCELYIPVCLKLISAADWRDFVCLECPFFNNEELEDKESILEKNEEMNKIIISRPSLEQIPKIIKNKNSKVKIYPGFDEPIRTLNLDVSLKRDHDHKPKYYRKESAIFGA